MNQPTDIHKENNDIVAPESLEWRMDALVQELLMSNNIALESLVSDAYKIAQSFPMNHFEVEVALPYVANKIIKWFLEKLNEGDRNMPYISYPRAFLSLSFYIAILTVAYQEHWSHEILQDYDVYNLDPKSTDVLISAVQAVFLQLLYQGNTDEIQQRIDHLKLHLDEKDIYTDSLLDGSDALTEEFFGLSLELYPVWSQYRSVQHWVNCISKAEGHEKERLLNVPLIWSEAEFKKQSRLSALKNHITVWNKSYKFDDLHRKMYLKGVSISPNAMGKPTFYIQILLDEHGKIVFQHIFSSVEDRLGVFVFDSSKVAKTKAGHLDHAVQHIGDVQNMGKDLFSHIQKIKSPVFDEQKTVEILEDVKWFDAQESPINHIQSVVENVSHNTTTLTSKTFIDPRKHHTDIGRSLWLEILDHGEDIWVSEGIITSHLRYKNGQWDSNLHYIPKIAWLIDMLEDIIPKNEHGKIAAYTLPSSPYIFIYTDTGTIFISDIDNVGTQVFAQKVDPKFINSDFSFAELWWLFWPLTSVKNNFEEIISEESADTWTWYILDALNKKDGYFLDLRSDEQHHWWINLRTLYESWKMTKNDFATPPDLKRFLEDYNKKLLLRSDISIKEKQILSVTNSRGWVPAAQPLINALWGHPFFTSYHGHTSFFSEYLDALLLNRTEQTNTLYEKLRSKNIVKTSIQSWLNEFKKWNRTLSEYQFHELFSIDIHTKRWMRKELNVPFGLFTSVSWIIALGYNPEQSAEWETSEAYLYRILIEGGILKNKL